MQQINFIQASLDFEGIFPFKIQAYFILVGGGIFIQNQFILSSIWLVYPLKCYPIWNAKDLIQTATTNIQLCQGKDDIWLSTINLCKTISFISCIHCLIIFTTLKILKNNKTTGMLKKIIQYTQLTYDLYLIV